MNASPPAASGTVPAREAVIGRLELTVGAVSSELVVIRRTVHAWLGAQAVPAGLVTDILLVVDEAVANSVEHGYRDQPAGPVTVTLENLPAPQRAVRVRVRDHGRWRAPRPDPDQHRGRGLGIIHALATAVDIRVEAGTAVDARFVLHPPPEDASLPHG